MEMYILKNEDGTQSVSKTKNKSSNLVGLWKLKSIKFEFVHNIISEFETYTASTTASKENLSFISNDINYKTYIFTSTFNNYIRKKQLKIENEKNYLPILNYIKSISNKNDYVTIPSILKHFDTINTPIHKQVLLDMVKLDFLNKSYHKVKITKKGFEYIK